MHQRDPQQAHPHRYRDALTGLWTGHTFRGALQEALAREPAPAGTIAVCLVCLRNFRDVNEDEGFEAGDAALQAVARRLVDAVGSDGFVARIGGDQFGVLLEPIADDGDAADVAGILLAVVETPLSAAELPPSQLRLRGRSLLASVGAAVSAPGLSAEELWRRADEATCPAERGVGGRRSVLYGEVVPGAGQA